MPAFGHYFGDGREYFDEDEDDYMYYRCEPRHRRCVLIPGLAEYYKTPSRENARALLVSMHLPVPYATLVKPAVPVAKPDAASAQGQTTSRANAQTPPKKQSAAAEYFNTPSVENARNFLRSMGFPVPYSTIVQSDEPTEPEAPDEPAEPDEPAAGAVASPESFDESLVKPKSSKKKRRSRRGRSMKKAEPFEQLALPAAFEVYREISLIRDIFIFRFLDSVSRRFLKGLNAPKAVIEALMQLAKSYLRFGHSQLLKILPRLIKISEEIFGLAPLRTHTLTFKLARPTTATSIDQYLYAKVRSWYSRPSLEIVLDGIFCDVRLPRSNRIHANNIAHLNLAVNTSVIAKSLAFCAYLQLLLSEWDTVPTVASSERIQTKEIRFLVGDFQTKTSRGNDFFISEWVSHIRKETAYLSLLEPSAIGTRRITVADIPSLSDTPFANVTAGALGLHVKLPDRQDAAGYSLRSAISEGTFVPYGCKRVSISPLKPYSLLEKPPLIDRCLPKFFTSNPKTWVTLVFDEHFDEDDPTPETSAFIETLATVNAFRDALRAEVALARDAVYITPDALRLVYYQARADQMADSGKLHQGLMVHSDGPDDLAISYYTPKRTAPAPPAPSGI
jgi:hypothetical protein